MTEHSLQCDAPICHDDHGKALWYPGESVCGKTPFKKFQKRQAKINRWIAKGEMKYPHGYWTAAMIEKTSRMSKGMKGIDPDTGLRSHRPL